jgi:hypothetical protein
MAYHLFMDKDSFEVERPALEGPKLRDGNRACFYNFEYDFHQKIVSEGNHPYLGMILLETVETLIKDFNKRFQNIKIEIVFQRKFTDYANYTIHVSNYFVYKADDLEKKSSFYVLTLKFNEKYTVESMYHLTSPILQFIRNLAPMTAYCDHFDWYYKQRATIANFLKIHNGHEFRGDYGTWCRQAPTKTQFMLMDNIDHMNELCSKLSKSMYYGTDLMKTIITNKPPEDPVEEPDDDLDENDEDPDDGW